MTAHELRTPIGVLRGSVEVLSRHLDELTAEERAELVEGMASSTGRLSRLLSDLLTASRLEASALEMRAETVPVREVLDQAVAVVKSTHPAAEILVRSPRGRAVHADRDRLAQALENLLGNALRHGAPPVHVAVTATEAGALDIRVRDSGPGVAAAVRPRLFSRFATGLASGGTGLGLFIVRELARAQGGDARYEPGPAGSPAGEFVIRLPACIGSGRGFDGRPVTAPLRVLLVDDVVDVRRLVRTALRFRGGFEVVGEAGDGAGAVRLAGETHPDIVVLDLGLPDIAGREVLSRIRENSPESKVVVFSGLETPDRTWIEGRVEGYVLKDAELDYLVDLLESVGKPPGGRGVVDLATFADQRGRRPGGSWSRG